MMRSGPDAAFFIDSSYVDDDTDPAELEWLLSVPHRTQLVQPVVRELGGSVVEQAPTPIVPFLQRVEQLL